MGWREQVLNVAKQSKCREIREGAEKSLRGIRMAMEWQEKKAKERRERLSA